MLTAELSVTEPPEERVLECLLELLRNGFDEARTRKRIEEIPANQEAAYIFTILPFTVTLRRVTSATFSR
jgi:hypothetical protein